MNVNEVLNRHTNSIRRTGSYITLTSGNSSAIWPIIERLSYREIELLRTLHLELTLEPESPDSVEQFLIDHIDLNIAQLLDSSFSTSKYDRNTETGFINRKKMQQLFDLLHLRAYSEISFQEFFENYSVWLEENSISDLLTSQSSRKINEVFTFFIVQEQGAEFFENISAILENMIDDIYTDYSKRLSSLCHISADWNSTAEKLFSLMDDNKKGHITAEGLQLWTLSQTISKVSSMEPILLRKQTFSMLQEMKHTNGLVTMRNFKNYLINSGLTSLATLQDSLQDLIKVKNSWQEVRLTVFSSEQFAKYRINTQHPENSTLWEQCITVSIQEFISSDKERGKLFKFLKFAGLILGSTPNLATKGIVYMQGTYLRDISEFSVYLMSNYLQIMGQYHTSASVLALTQQTIDSLSSDCRFKAIRKALQTYDSLLNIILYEVIAKTEKKVEKVQVEKGDNSLIWQYSSNTSILNGIARSVSYNKVDKGQNKSPVRKNYLKKSGSSAKSRENIASCREFSGNLEKSIGSKQDSRPLTPNRNEKIACQPSLSPKPIRRPNDKKRDEASRSPLRMSGSGKVNRPRTPTRDAIGNQIEVKSVLTKEKVINSARTPAKEKPQKESYEQVIKRLINKKL